MLNSHHAPWPLHVVCWEFKGQWDVFVALSLRKLNMKSALGLRECQGLTEERLTYFDLKSRIGQSRQCHRSGDHWASKQWLSKLFPKRSVNILGVTDHTLSAASTQLGCWGLNRRVQVNGCDWVTTKLYLPTGCGPDLPLWPAGLSPS